MTRIGSTSFPAASRSSGGGRRRRFTYRLGPVLVSVLLAAGLGCQEDAEPPTAPEPALAVTPSHTLRFRQVTAGEEHTCGLATNHLAYCWGNSSTTPVRVPGGLAFRQVSAEGGTCGVTSADVAYCWGSNHVGQLGDGTFTDSPRPVRVAGGLAFRQVSVGSLHTCGVTTSNAAYCWGHNQAGPLGDGTTNLSQRPVRVARGLAFREVSAGNQFTCGVTTEDVAYCWGLNSSGQLGTGSDTGPETCFTGDGFPSCSTRPVRVVRGLTFDHVDAGNDHACGVTTDAVTYCWGGNQAGQLGVRTSTGPEPCSDVVPCSTRPVRVAGGHAFRQVSAGEYRTCGVTTGDVAYCWGLNFSGELGIGTSTGPEICSFYDAPCSLRPMRVVGGLAFREVSPEGAFHICGVTTARLGYCWGSNFDGQLGDGTTRDRLRPSRVAGVTEFGRHGSAQDDE